MQLYPKNGFVLTMNTSILADSCQAFVDQLADLQAQLDAETDPFHKRAIIRQIAEVKRELVACRAVHPNLVALIRDIMDATAPDSYRFVVCNQTSILGSGFHGYSRTTSDPPALRVALDDRLNIASMSKTLTAVAVLSALQEKHLEADTLVADFLPTEWTLNSNVKRLTFRDFLTHRTGFDETTDKSDYDGIRNSLEVGPPNAIQRDYNYRNINFAIFRIILPYLDSYDPKTQKVQLVLSGNEPPERVLASLYIASVNKRVLTPSGVAVAGCDSKTLVGGLPVLLYGFNPGDTHGVDLGDQTLVCGAEGWSLSVKDYARFLQALLFTEILVSNATRALMLTGGPLEHRGLGMNLDHQVAGSNVYSHGAWIPVGDAQVAGWYLYFQATDIIVVALSNAGHNPHQPNWFDSVKGAYARVFAH